MFYTWYTSLFRSSKVKLKLRSGLTGTMHSASWPLAARETSLTIKIYMLMQIMTEQESGSFKLPSSFVFQYSKCQTFHWIFFTLWIYCKARTHHRGNAANIKHAAAYWGCTGLTCFVEMQLYWNANLNENQFCVINRAALYMSPHLNVPQYT